MMLDRNGRVLYIDDSKDTCEMMATLLADAGLKVEYRLSAGEGLTLAKHGGFDLILLDWVLPDGSGTELCRTIRTFDPRTPIVFLSGRSHVSDQEEALDAGAQAFLMKPVGINELLSTLSQLRRNSADPA